MKAHVHLWLFLTEFFLECEMFQEKVDEKIKTHIFMFNSFFFIKNYAANEIM
jgi:hypothetical protein